MSSNATCHQERAEDGPPLFQNGRIALQVYHIGWIISGFFVIFATSVSFWLIDKHLQWYTNKREQRYIVRILFMVPIYALVSFASFLFWNHSTVLILIRDAYESTVLTSFFYLLLTYISHDPEEQKAVFLKVGLSREADREAKKKGKEIKKWIFPLGFIQWKPQDGLYFLQLTKWGILQYCIIRPTTTLAAIILDYLGLYCEQSWGLGWGHIYISVIVSISVTIAMYCLIQLYVPISANLAPRRPLLGLFAIKAVVFLTFWQATFLSLLSMVGVVKDIKYMTAADVNIGIEAVLETFEMTIFAFLHIHAFSYKPYQPLYPPHSTEPGPEKTLRLRSLGHAMDFRETLREIWIGCIYIWDKIHGREPSYDIGARRTAHYTEAFGRPRASRLMEHNGRDETNKDQATLPKVEIDVEECIDVDIEGEKQWLGLGDDYGYGLHFARRERSDSLGVQIERELEKRGLTIENSRQENNLPEFSSGKGPSRHWWHRIYNRSSGYGSEDEQGYNLSLIKLMAHKPKRRSERHSRGVNLKDFDGSLAAANIDDPPPLPNIIPHQCHCHSQRSNLDDILAPLPISSDPTSPRQRESVSRSNSITLVDNDQSQPASSSLDSLRESRVFSHTTDSRSAELASTALSTHEVAEGEGRAPTLKATRYKFGKYYDLGLGHDPEDRYAHVPSTIPMVDLSFDSDSKESRFRHRQEFALDSEATGAVHSSPHLPGCSSAPFRQNQVGLTYSQICAPEEHFSASSVPRSPHINLQQTRSHRRVSERVHSWIDSQIQYGTYDGARCTGSPTSLTLVPDAAKARCTGLIVIQ